MERNVSHSEPSTLFRNSLASVVAALTDLSEWQGVLATHRLDGRVAFRRNSPISLEGHATNATPVVRDRDLDCIRHWFEVEKGVQLSKQNAVDAVRMVADRHAFHPVRDYLETLTWDGTPRVHRWLEDYAHVHPSNSEHGALVRSVAKKWLVSAVARAMEPGCKVDTMLILEGEQGIGKSRALAALASPAFFSDAAIDFGSKDAFQTIQGVWIYELDELDAILRRDPSTVKAFSPCQPFGWHFGDLDHPGLRSLRFLSRPVDRFRAPYGRTPESDLEPPFTMDEVLAGPLGLKTSSQNSSVTTRVSRLLGRLGYQRVRRAAHPRVYQYVRAVSPSCRPSGSATTSTPLSHRSLP